jgi:hypothetical protein
LSFSITLLGSFDTGSVTTGELGLGIATTDFRAIKWIASEAAFFHQLISFVRALRFSIAHLGLEEAFTILAGIFGCRITSTDFRGVVVETIKAALLISLVGFVRAIDFAITDLAFEDTFAIIASSFSLLVATTGLVRIGSILFETTLFFLLVSFISTLSSSIAKSLERDTLSIRALPLIFSTSTALVIIIAEFLETTDIVTFIIRTNDLVYCIGPSTAHSDTRCLITVVALLVIDLIVGLLVATVDIVASTPSVMLESKVLVILTSFSASLMNIAIFHWAISEVSVTIIFIAANVFVGILGAVGFSITLLGSFDAGSVTTGELGLGIATTDFIVISAKLLKATLTVTFITLIRALSFSVTETCSWDTLSRFTGVFCLGVAATDLGVVGRETLEAALIIDLLGAFSKAVAFI